MPEIKDRLNDLKETHGLSVKKFAEVIGVSPSTIYMYLRGERQPNKEIMENIADYFNVDIDYLYCRSDIANKALEYGYMPIINDTKREHKYTVPIVGEVACGVPIFAEQNILGYTNIDRNDNVDFALYAKGDSMNNAKIDDGDLIYIRQQPAVENGDIAVVLVNNENATIKKFYDYGEKIVLRPDSTNPEHKEQIYDKKENSITIQGKVVFIKTFVR